MEKMDFIKSFALFNGIIDAVQKEFELTEDAAIEHGGNIFSYLREHDLIEEDIDNCMAVSNAVYNVLMRED